MREKIMIMEATRPLETTLRRYVLGTLDEEPRLQLEERVITDADVFDALGIVEDELTEEYLEGRLPAADRRDFEAHFLASSEHRRQVAFLRELKQHAAGTRQTTTGNESRVTRWFAAVFSWEPAWAGAVAALLLVSAAGTAWFAVRSMRLDDRLEGVRSQQIREAQDQARLQGRVDTLAAETRALQGRLDEEARRRQQAEARLAEAQTAVRPEAASPVFALSAGTLRSGGSLTRIAVPDASPVVRLRLAVPADEYPFHRATLYDAQGEELWTQTRLRAVGQAGQTAIVLILPTHLLSRGDYQIKLSGVAENGRLEPLATYSFRVTTP